MKILWSGSNLSTGLSNCLWIFLLVATAFHLIVPGIAEASEEESIRQLVQKPVAVDKLIEAGYPDRDVRVLSRTLNEAGVLASDFHEVLLNLPYFAGNINNLKGSVNFVVQQHKRGLEGSELVRAFRDELAGQGLDWRSGPEPISAEYFGSNVRNILSRVRESIQDRRGFEQGTPEPPSSDQGRTSPPSSGSPGPGGPQGPGSPRGPGTPNRPF